MRYSAFVKAAAMSATIMAISAPANACSCLFPESAAAQLDRAGVAFIGTVIDTGPKEVKTPWWHVFAPWREKPKPNWDAEHVTTFQVERMLKGPDTLDTMTFVHGVSGAACGVSYRTQQSGVFIGYQNSDGFYSTSSCSSARYSEEEFIAVADALQAE